jgi:cyclopropane fatty-acyl-phospholipid synthase-like methyltransferase
MMWNKTYSLEKRLWGDEPSELAQYALTFLKNSSQYETRKLGILDLGCGYGRDALYLAQNLGCHILGLDNSEEAIRMATESVPANMKKQLEFLAYDFSHVIDKFDIIFTSNLYQLLNVGDRAGLRSTVVRCLDQGGSLFLSTLSVHDPQLFGQGTRVEGEENSFTAGKYHHFCTRQELEADFDFLKISALFEREYREAHSSGEIHTHISWILCGKRA